MWQKLFSGPWPDSANILPPAVQQQAADRVRDYWRTRGWQLVLGEVALWIVAEYQRIPNAFNYGLLAGLVAFIYVLGLLPNIIPFWLIISLGLLLLQGMVVDGLGAVTALTFLMPYTFAGMLLSGRQRVLVQLCCMAAFWTSLISEVVPFLPRLHPPSHILVGYDILLAAFTFETLRFLSQLAVELNTVYVAEEVQQRGNQFLARVSHELRTPLNSVLGFARLLRRGDLNETQAQYLNQIVDEGEHLNRLVSDLLDSAHLATGNLTLNLESCDVNAICQAVAEEQRPNLSPQAALLVNLSADLPQLQADPVRLRQVVANLVSNAVKYTAQGSISLETFLRGDHVCIQVRDSGIGISEAEQQLIFLPFVQVDNRRVGVGLGLDIALRLTRLHGGDIHLSSAPGEGSTFTVQLPLNSD